MNSIKKTGNCIKGHLQKKNIEKVSQQANKPVKQYINKKKITFYIDVETQQKLSSIHAKKILKNEKVDKSLLLCRAINLLWKEESKIKS